jgi:hypothetical protein
MLLHMRTPEVPDALSLKIWQLPSLLSSIMDMTFFPSEQFGHARRHAGSLICVMAREDSDKAVIVSFNI